MRNTELKLRPHHVLCLQFFEGRGYDAAFVQGVRAALRRLENDGRFTVTDGPDALCEACPHNRDGVCFWQEKTRRYDARAMDALGLALNGAADFSAFTKAQAAAAIPLICADCEWYSVCGG